MAKKPKAEKYDLIIVGGGPAGLSAGIYAARQKIKALMITKNFGGQLLWTNLIENFPSYKTITGKEFLEKLVEHFKEYKMPVETDEVLEIIKTNKRFLMETAKKKFEAKAVILTAGRISKKLNVPGENKFLGKGISSCTVCDAPLFKEKEVAVVGTGDVAANAVLHLANYAKKIYLLTKYLYLKGDKIKAEKILGLEKQKKVEILYEAKVLEILGDKFVEKLKLEHKGKEKMIDVKGIFVEIGMAPETEMTNEIEKNEKGEILINNQCETNIKGFFAAGDCTNIAFKQDIIACGEGAKAALAASRYLDSLE